MDSEPEYFDASPSAAFLMESIRDCGYTIETAIAEFNISRIPKYRNTFD